MKYLLTLMILLALSVPASGDELVSDSGCFAVAVNPSTKIVGLDWNGERISFKVDNLFAYRKSTDTRTLIATSNFTDVSFKDTTITIHNIYPYVDLEIENTPDGWRHQFIFHPAARDQFENWWQNNGSFDDIYIIHTYRLYFGQSEIRFLSKIRLSTTTTWAADLEFKVFSRKKAPSPLRRKYQKF